MLKYEVGEIVDGVITGIESYGFFVDTDDGNKGLVHISEISDGFVGEKIKVEIIEVISDNQYRLSVKNTCGFNNKNTSIRETPSGFSTLKKKLPVWIEKKLKEISENTVKK